MNRAGSIGGHLGQALSSLCPVTGWIRRQKTSAFSKHDLMRAPALTGAWKGNMWGHSPLLGFSTEISQWFPACFYTLFNLNSISSHRFVLLFFFRYRYKWISMGKPWSGLMKAVSFMQVTGCLFPTGPADHVCDCRIPMASNRFPPGTEWSLRVSWRAESRALCFQPIGVLNNSILISSYKPLPSQH